MSEDDVGFQGQFRRHKDVWNVLNMPHKEYLKFGQMLNELPKDNFEIFISKFTNLLIETAEKYGLKIPD